MDTGFQLWLKRSETNELVRQWHHEDISERKNEEKLEFQATHDELTGLFNQVELAGA